MVKYKYFLIYDKHTKVIYGECIKWMCGEFDSTEVSDVSVNLKKKFKARMMTTNKRLDYLDENSKVITINNDISFPYKEMYRDFITQRSDEEIFSPMIDRCSNIDMFVGNEISSNNFLGWVAEYKHLLEEINSRFNLNLLKRPELINSYTFYKPTRIVVNCKFTDKPYREEERLPTKMKVTFYDEFGVHKHAKYIITGYIEGVESHSTEGMVSEKELNIDFETSPDELEIKILDHSSVIYNSKHGFLRSIQIQGKVKYGSVVLENGSKVSRYSKLDINVRKD